MTLTARRITAPVAAHGEGPVWDAAAALVRWVDMPAGAVRSIDLALGAPDAVPASTPVADFVALIRPRVGGGWVACTRDAILLLDAGFGLERRIPVPMGPDERFNDGTVAPDGSLYAGTMALDGTGRLLRLQPDGRLSTVLTGLRISNGIAPTPDGARLVHVDSPQRRVDCYDLDESGIRARRTLIDLGDVDGVPDGLAVDADGGVWVAMWGGRCVRGFDARGRAVAVIEVPTAQPSSCAFVGADLGTLAITTSQQDLDVADDPQSGAMFAAEPGVVGVVPLAFAG